MPQTLLTGLPGPTKLLSKFGSVCLVLTKEIHNSMAVMDYTQWDSEMLTKMSRDMM